MTRYTANTRLKKVPHVDVYTLQIRASSDRMYLSSRSLPLDTGPPAQRVARVGVMTTPVPPLPNKKRKNMLFLFKKIHGLFHHLTKNNYEQFFLI